MQYTKVEMFRDVVEDLRALPRCNANEHATQSLHDALRIDTPYSRTMIRKTMNSRTMNIEQESIRCNSIRKCRSRCRYER